MGIPRRLWLVAMATTTMLTLNGMHAGAAAPPKQDATTATFPGARFNEAQRVLDAGDTDRSYDLFAELFREYPDSLQVNFAYGMACRAAGRFSHARFAFERVLMADPTHDRARLELGRTLAEAGLWSMAQREFDTVLAHDPPAPVRETVESYMARMERQSRRSFFAGRVDVGLLYDDNVNIGPESDQIRIRPVTIGPFVFDALETGKEARPVEDYGLYASAVLSDAVDIGSRGGWLLAGQLSGYANWLEDAHDYESQFYEFSLDARYATRRCLLQLPAFAAQTRRGGDRLVNVFGVAPALLYATGHQGNRQWRTLSRVEWRDFEEDRKAYNGVYATLGEALRMLFPERNLALDVAGRLFHDHTDADIYRHTGIEGSLRLEAELPCNTRLHGRARYAYLTFEEREPLAPEDRRDDFLELGAGLSFRLRPQWGIDVNYTYTDNTSTFDLYEYQRNVAALSTWITF